MILYFLYLLYSASVGMKTVLPNPLNEEIYEQIETNKSNKFSTSGENKREEEEALTSVDMKSVLPNPPNKEIHERIETNKSNTFSISEEENKSEEEEASKDQESRETKTYRSSSNNDKAKRGEYVLNCPPKKPGGGEVYENNTTTTMSCETVSEHRRIVAKQYPNC